jgi:hypothetical protein
MYLCFWVYRYTTLFPQVYSNFPPYKMKWNSLFFNILSRLYSNIVCKNIGKFFQKFEVGWTQTCTTLKSNIMWHPKGGHCSVHSFQSFRMLLWNKNHPMTCNFTLCQHVWILLNKKKIELWPSRCTHLDSTN